jgi:hypothetical protein
VIPMMREAARMLMRIGLVLLVMALVVRPFIRNQANMVGDDLAAIVSAALVLTAFAYVRFTRD